MQGKFVWFDVAATDPAKVSEFYEGLFGWPTAEGPPGSAYAGWFTQNGVPWAGVTEADDATAGRWVPYVEVDDLAAARERAMALGATIVHDSTVGPGGTAITIVDPSGGLVALFVPHPS